MEAGRTGRSSERLALVLVCLAIVTLSVVVGRGKGFFTPDNASGMANDSPTPTTGASVGWMALVTNTRDGKVSQFKLNAANGTLALAGTTSVGSGSGLTGVTIDFGGQFAYVVSSADDSVYEFRITAGGQLAPIGPGSVSDGAGSAPQQIAIAKLGSGKNFAYVTNAGNGSISEYAIATDGTLTALGSTVTGLANPFGIRTLTNANGTFLYVTDSSTGLIYAYSVQPDGALAEIDSAKTLPSGGGNPGLIAINQAATYLYVDDLAGGQVSEFAIGTDGALSFVTNTSALAGEPIGIATATNGGIDYVYVAYQAANEVVIYRIAGGAIQTVGNVGGLDEPTGIAVDSTGSFVYVTNQGNGTVSEYAINGSCGKLLCPAGTFNSENPLNDASGPLYLRLSQP